MRRSASLLVALAVSCSPPPPDAPGVTDWILDDPALVGGLETEVAGDPRRIDGPALEFDGVDDGVFVDVHPLAGAKTFTVEARFRPAPDGPEEQRWLHLQEAGSSDRILLETRMRSGGRWFLDSYVKTSDKGYVLYAKKFLHPADRWYHVALVVDEREMRHYVDGELEMSRPIRFRPQRSGGTSIGVRFNRVSWFRGAISRVRFTPRALTVEEFFHGGAQLVGQ